MSSASPALIDLETFCRRARMSSFLAARTTGPAKPRGMVYRVFHPRSERGEYEDLRWSPMYTVVLVREYLLPPGATRQLAQLYCGSLYGAGISPRDAERYALREGGLHLQRMEGVLTFEQWLVDQPADERGPRVYQDDRYEAERWTSFLGAELTQLLTHGVDLDPAAVLRHSGPRIDLDDADPAAQPRANAVRRK